MDREQSLDPVVLKDPAKNGRPLTSTQKRFYASSLCEEARELLQALVDSPGYNTDPSRLTDNSISFVERHLHYLSIYPQIDVVGYISNLKLMTSTKRSGTTA